MVLVIEHDSFLDEVEFFHVIFISWLVRLLAKGFALLIFLEGDLKYFQN